MTDVDLNVAVVQKPNKVNIKKNHNTVVIKPASVIIKEVEGTPFEISTNVDFNVDGDAFSDRETTKLYIDSRFEEYTSDPAEEVYLVVDVDGTSSSKLIDHSFPYQPIVDFQSLTGGSSVVDVKYPNASQVLVTSILPMQGKILLK